MPLPFTKDLTMWSPISIFENTSYFSNFYVDQSSGDNIINESLMSTNLDPFSNFQPMHEFATSLHDSQNACYLCSSTTTSTNHRHLEASPSALSLQSTAAGISHHSMWRYHQKKTKAAAAAQATPSPPFLNHHWDCQPPSFQSRKAASNMRWAGHRTSSPSTVQLSENHHNHHHHHHHPRHYRYVPHYNVITTPKPCSSSLFSHDTVTPSCSFFQKCWVWWKSILQFKKKYIHPIHKRKS